MSRQKREYSDIGMYHIHFRGVNHCHIFEENEDYTRFLSKLCEIKDNLGFRIYAYCLMSNHVHLIIHEQELGGISGIMKSLLTPYVGWFNRKYQRVGSLVSNRYKSECLKDDRYLITLLKYIHLNPVRAGMTNRPASYKWSSYNEYVNGNSENVDCDFVFSVLSADRKTAIKNFIELHNVVDDNDIAMPENGRKTESDVRQAIMKELCGKEPNELTRMGKTERTAAIQKLRDSGLSIRQIERATGVSRGIIARC